jgi:starch-binding outer membrane protein, SusD/RagB family
LQGVLHLELIYHSKIFQMKLIKLIFIITLIIYCLSCKKEYLDLDPINNYTFYNFPQTEAQVNETVVACYRQLVPIYGDQMWVFGEMLSDNTSFQFNSANSDLAIKEYDEFVGASGDGTVVSNAYRDFYQGITRAHYALESIDKIPFSSDSVKTIRVGEAKFFRAFHYFNLVRLYGDVPIIKKVITNPDPAAASEYPRKPVNDVYNEMIIPDAIEAISKLPATVPPTQKGRLTKAAAYMLLGKVYLTLNRFPEALTNFDAVTGFTLNASYAANFTPATKNGVESIFEIQTNPNISNGFFFGFGARWAPAGTGSFFWTTSPANSGGLNQPTQNLFNAYETGDLRRRPTLDTLTVGTVKVLGMKKFMYPNAANAQQVNDAQWPIYRFAETILSRAECLNEISFPNATAFTLLNQIRTRAGLPNKTQGNANPALAINTQAEFRLAIEQERRVEFAGEAHRWFDLIRTNRAVTVMTAHGAEEKLLKPTITPGGYLSIKTLLGIPQREVIQFGYTQNPGW